jgi:hypothetical protein
VATPTLGNVPVTLDDAESLTGWTITSGALDGDLKKEGSNAVFGILRLNLATATYDIVVDAGSAQDMTGRHVRLWWWFNSVGLLEIEANGGMEFFMYDGTSTAYWVIAGSDTYEGGWFNLVLDCDSTPDSGSVDKTIVRAWGLRYNRTAAPRNVDNTWLDYLRWGDGYYATGGLTGDRIELPGIVGVDGANGYGIIEVIEGVFFSKGELQLGNGATTTWFDMLAEVLVFTDAPVATGLYTIRGEGTGCRVNIDSSVIRGAGSTDATRFIFDMDDADLVSLSLIDSFLTRAGECRFKSGQVVTGNTFADCGQILSGGADFTGTTVVGYEGAADSAALVWNENADPDGELDDMVFANANNDSTLLISRTSGTVTINLVGVTGTVTFKTAGATVVLVSDPVTTTITVRDIVDQALVENARVLLLASDGTGDLPYQASVTIARSGSVATVAHTGHGMTTGDIVEIVGANQQEYNGAYSITVTGANEYTYTLTGTPATPATGTITATGGIFNELTSASGIVTDTRAIGNDQPFTGVVRKGSASVLYRSQPIVGTIDNLIGFTVTVQLIPDE